MTDRPAGGDTTDDATDGAGDAGDAADTRTVRTRPCPYCGAPMRHRHCEYVCPAHGVVMDCSDTFFHR